MTVGPREKKLLAALGAALALVVVVRATGGGGGSDVGGGETATVRRGADRGGAEVRDVVEMNLAALRPSSATYELERDPFRYGVVPTPPPPPPPPPPPAPEPTQIVEVEPVWTPPPPPPPPPSDHLKFLGTFGPPRARIAVIVSGEEIYNVREGAVLEDKFIVQEIGYESVAIAFVGFPDAPPRRLAAGG